MNEEINVPIEETRDLIEEFSQFKLPESFYKMGISPFGSLSYTKIIVFCC
jgi:hypothetical protein